MNTHSDWISVKDRLPKGEPVWRWDGHEVRLWEQHEPMHFTAYGVTHWMPATLPEPPKSEAETAFEKWANFKPIGSAVSCDLAKNIFLAGWQAHEKRGEGS